MEETATIVPYLSLERMTALHGEELRQAVERVVESGRYLFGDETAAFEREWAAYCRRRHCVACGNGIDALTLTLRAWRELGLLREGDEVLVPANTFIASILAVTESGLRPILVDAALPAFGIDALLAERAVTPRTRALLLVHLYGYNAWNDGIRDLCRRHNLLLLEDCAQAHGLTEREASASRISETHEWSDEAPASSSFRQSIRSAAAYSFYPGKNLGALGDAGCVVTDDDELATVVRSLANYGSSEKYVFERKGRNSRMDEIQAAVLRVKLPYLDDENRRRHDIATLYIGGIHAEEVTLPPPDGVHHIFPLLCRDRDTVRRRLRERGIETIIHYPTPPHLQRAYREWNTLSFPVTERIAREELSLPCNATMSDDDVHRVIAALNDNQWSDEASASSILTNSHSTHTSSLAKTHSLQTNRQKNSR